MDESEKDWTVGNHDDWSLGYDGSGNASGQFILDGQGRVVGASLRAHRGLDGPGSVETNALLFAASPKLLAAAKAVVAADDEQELSQEEIEQLRAAIIAAEGQP